MAGALSSVLSNSVGQIIALIFSFFMWLFFAIVLLVVGIYVYSSLAYMAIGKKAKDEKAWLAWIPIVGKPLLVSRIAEMPWWPIFLIFGEFFIFIPIVGTFLSWACMLIFSVFYLIWMWKTFEKVGKPGWWILLILIPFAGILIFFILLGIAAWSRDNNQ